MKISRSDLEAAAGDGIIDSGQAARLWAFLAGRAADTPSFKAAHILYYLGGLVAIGAISLFITLAWDRWAGTPMLLLSVALAVFGIAMTERFLERGLRLPAGIMVTFAVATIPLATYSVQHLIGFWDGGRDVADYHRHIDWRWLFMELATLVAAAVALWRYREPFTLMLVAVTAWYLSMDLVPLLQNAPGSWRDYWELRKLVTLYLGLTTLLLAFWVDLRSGRTRDYAFWLYLAGVLMFWCGLTAMDSDSELSKFFYMLVNLAMVFTGAALRRRVFAVFGAIGIAVYLGHLATLFADSLLFPVALAAIGLLIIFAGIAWQKHERELHHHLVGLMPISVKKLLERAQS